MTRTVDLPPGFSLYRGRWSHLALADFGESSGIAWEQRTLRAYGREVPTPRLTAWYGEASYTYSGIAHAPAALPSHLARVRHEVGMLLGGAGPTLEFNSVLCNLYRDGRDSVAWHADDEPELGLEPTIASVSLGATRTFHVRTRWRRCAPGELARTYSVKLEHGDLLVMSGRSQLDYEHAVPKTAREVGARVNLTFRQVAA